VGRLIGGSMFLAGMLVMAFNVWQTIRHAGEMGSQNTGRAAERGQS